MVDEYQDTNYAQAKLVETLVAGHRNLFVVADDDQSIYKFRGASRANLDRFGREYPEHRQLVLTHNYRSTDQIVAASRALIGVASPATRIEKRLIADRGPGAAVEVWRAPEERSEAMAVARECARLIASGMRPADIAWLFRQHVDMQPAMRALRQCGVPYQVAGGRGFFQEREVKDALALLAAIEDPDDSQAVLRCLTLPGWGVTTAGRVALVRAAHQHDVPLVVLVADAAVEDLDAVDLAAAQRCVQDIHELHAASQREDVRDLFQLALEASGFLGIIDEQSGVARLQMGANLNKLGELLETFADWSDDRRVSTALRYLGVLRDSRDGGELPSIEAIEDGVVLLTAHGSKGLEWPVVFLSRCTERRWQGRTTSSSDLQLPDDLVPEPPPPGDVAVDEERRLFYVASTRARDRLVYTWARSYPQPSSEESCTPFLTMAMSLRGGSVLSKELPADSTVAVRAPRPAGRSGAPAPVHRRVRPGCVQELPAPLQLPATLASPGAPRRAQLVRHHDPRGAALRGNPAHRGRGGQWRCGRIHVARGLGPVARPEGTSRRAARTRRGAIAPLPGVTRVDRHHHRPGRGAGDDQPRPRRCRRSIRPRRQTPRTAFRPSSTTRPVVPRRKRRCARTCNCVRMRWDSRSASRPTRSRWSSTTCREPSPAWSPTRVSCARRTGTCLRRRASWRWRRAPDRFHRSRRAGNVSAAISGPSATRDALLRATSDRRRRWVCQLQTNRWSANPVDRNPLVTIS